MFKYNRGILHQPITDLFVLNKERHNYNTRQTDDLQINAGGSEIIYKLISFHGVHIWYHISQQIQIDVSYACFKQLTKTYLQNNYILYRAR